MYSEIYLFMYSIAFLFMLLSFLKRDNIVFMWLSTIFFFVLGLVSYNVENEYCQMDITNTTWYCHTTHYVDTGMGYLNFGLGIIMLIFAIVESLKSGGQALEGGVSE